MLPRIGRIHEVRIHDLFVDVEILFEGKRATQAHVHNNAHAPHVDRVVVDALLLQLRSCVRASKVSSHSFG